MFSFHKPKVYRSPTGCCICKAKSSSSRFTDSRKYEQDFLQCFQLAAPRQGEICNACVLLVKRWKKLPAGSSRNWRHVVDARAGPGMKSMIKFKSKNKHLISGNTNKTEQQPNEDKFFESKERETSPTLSDDTASDDLSGASSRAGSPLLNSDPEDTIADTDTKKTSSSGGRCRTKGYKKRYKSPTLNLSSFLDMTYWKREHVCCGIVFKGPNDDLMIDQRYLKPCINHRSANNNSTVVTSSSSSLSSETEHKTSSSSSSSSSLLKSFSDSSSDSGYDESSNPGAEQTTPPLHASSTTSLTIHH